MKDGERLSGRFFVAKCESAVGFLGFVQETGSGVVVTSELVVGREEREMETTSDLLFDLWSLCEVLTEEGEVVLA